MVYYNSSYQLLVFLGSFFVYFVNYIPSTILCIFIPFLFSVWSGDTYTQFKSF